MAGSLIKDDAYRRSIDLQERQFKHSQTMDYVGLGTGLLGGGGKGGGGMGGVLFMLAVALLIFGTGGGLVTQIFQQVSPVVILGVIALYFILR